MDNYVDKNTLLLLHCDDLTDSSFYNNTISKIGNVNVATLGKFDKCLDFTNTSSNNRLSIDSKPHNIGTGDFTIDMWLKFPSFAKRWQTWFASNISYTDLQLTVYYDTIRFYCGGAGDAAAITESMASLVNTWFHAAFVRHNGQLYIYINGKLACKPKPSNNVLQMTSPQIGYQPSYAGEAFNSYIDEIRFSNIARWTEDFIPPDRPYIKPVRANVLNSTEMVLSFVHELNVKKAMIYINDVFDKEYDNLKEDQITIHKYNLGLIKEDIKNIIKIETVNEDDSIGEIEFEYKYLPKLSSSSKTSTIFTRLNDFYDRQKRENDIFRNILIEKGITDDLTNLRYEELIEYVRLLGNCK